MHLSKKGVVVVDNYELYHYGVKGMKWGVRKKQSSVPSYRSTGVRSALARRSNEKVDAGFKDWNENSKKKSNAVDLGKKANVAKLAYEQNKSDKGLKTAYKQANKEYKKALSENTVYRKGVIRKEVGQDASRKYLSEAKKVKKQLTADPGNKELQKKYNELMSKHDVERAKARRAVEVGTKRSRRIASLKRSMTMSTKAVATSTAIAAGVYAANKYMTNHDVTVNGSRVNFSTQSVADVISTANKVRDFMGYFY